jgi:hypothetical protein
MPPVRLLPLVLTRIRGGDVLKQSIPGHLIIGINAADHDLVWVPAVHLTPPFVHATRCLVPSSRTESDTLTINF